MTRQRTPKHAPPAVRASLDDRVDRIESLLGRLAERLLAEPDDESPAEPEPPAAEDRSWEAGLSPEMRDALRRLPQPRLQRKDRHIKPRARYTLRRDASAPSQIDAVRSLTPGGVAVVVYLAQHPGTTVPEISAGTGIREKTVNNLISVLRRHQLLDE